MASHWPPERLPLMEVSLSVDGQTLIRRVASFDPGHYNRAATSTRRSNTDTDSNQAAKLTSENSEDLGFAFWVKYQKTEVSFRLATVFRIF